VLKNPTHHGVDGYGHHEVEEYGHHGVRGIPGKDYPVYSDLPPTSFTCDNVPARPGMYADVDSQCQVTLRATRLGELFIRTEFLYIQNTAASF
jgi:hypothetical protein